MKTYSRHGWRCRDAAAATYGSMLGLNGSRHRPHHLSLRLLEIRGAGQEGCW
jgi:hypothetical protein